MFFIHIVRHTLSRGKCCSVKCEFQVGLLPFMKSGGMLLTARKAGAIQLWSKSPPVGNEMLISLIQYLTTSKSESNLNFSWNISNTHQYLRKDYVSYFYSWSIFSYSRITRLSCDGSCRQNSSEFITKIVCLVSINDTWGQGIECMLCSVQLIWTPEHNYCDTDVFELLCLHHWRVTLK